MWPNAYGHGSYPPYQPVPPYHPVLPQFHPISLPPNQYGYIEPKITITLVLYWRVSTDIIALVFRPRDVLTTAGHLPHPNLISESEHAGMIVMMGQKAIVTRVITISTPALSLESLHHAPPRTIVVARDLQRIPRCPSTKSLTLGVRGMVVLGHHPECHGIPGTILASHDLEYQTRNSESGSQADMMIPTPTMNCTIVHAHRLWNGTHTSVRRSHADSITTSKYARPPWLQ